MSREETQLSDSARELEAVERELTEVQEQLRALAGKLRDAGAAGTEAALRGVEEEIGAARTRRDALQDRRLALRRKLAARDVEPGGIPNGDMDISRRIPRPGRPRGSRTARLIRGTVLTVLVAVATVACAGGAGYLLVTTFLAPPPSDVVAGGDGDVGAWVPTSLEEQLIGVYLALNRDAISAPAGADSTPVVFSVAPGEDAATIAAHLEEQGLVSDALLFRRLLRYRGADQSLVAGSYELNSAMTMDEIITTLQQGQVAEVAVTIPEGWRAEQIAELLEQEGLFAAEEYLAVVAQPARFEFDFLNALPPGATLEGFLFPDTYRVVPGRMTAEAFVRLQLETFDRRVPAELRDTAAQRGMTLFEAVTLASIVEREAVAPEERSLIAGVFINRWQDGTLLNADPTVQYALGGQDGTWWKRPLTFADLEVDSPYNTYKVPGLPPGPISNPGADAIRATITAPPTEFYYFVARGDGSGTHVFATTLEEHQQNVAREQGRE